LAEVCGKPSAAPRATAAEGTRRHRVRPMLERKHRTQSLQNSSRAHRAHADLGQMLEVGLRPLTCWSGTSRAAAGSAGRKFFRTIRDAAASAKGNNGQHCDHDGERRDQTKIHKSRAIAQGDDGGVRSQRAEIPWPRWGFTNRPVEVLLTCHSGALQLKVGSSMRPCIHGAIGSHGRIFPGRQIRTTQDFRYAPNNMVHGIATDAADVVQVTEKTTPQQIAPKKSSEARHSSGQLRYLVLSRTWLRLLSASSIRPPNL